MSDFTNFITHTNLPTGDFRDENRTIAALYIPNKIPDEEIKEYVGVEYRESCLALTTPKAKNGRWVCVLKKGHTGSHG